MKTTEQYFLVALYIIIYKVVLTFEFVDKILKCGHSNESYRELLSGGSVCCSIFDKTEFRIFIFFRSFIYRFWH